MRKRIELNQPTLFDNTNIVPKRIDSSNEMSNKKDAIIKAKSRPILPLVRAEFHRSMIGYSSYIKHLESYPEIYSKFVTYIVNVTGRIPFPIEEEDVKRGDEYLQRKMNKILDELYPQS